MYTVTIEAEKMEVCHAFAQKMKNIKKIPSLWGDEVTEFGVWGKAFFFEKKIPPRTAFFADGCPWAMMEVGKMSRKTLTKIHNAITNTAVPENGFAVTIISKDDTRRYMLRMLRE